MPVSEFERLFRTGVDHFNQREFWEAHEAWEELWLEASTEMHQFLQGLIQLAAAYHHAKRGTFPGGVRLFDAAQEKLRSFPPHHCGLDRQSAIAAAKLHREWIAARIGSAERLADGEYPKLMLGEDAPAAMPHDQW